MLDLEYLFKPLPRGEITSSWGGTTDLMHMQFAILVLLPLLWINVNVPSMRDLTSMYLLLATISLLIIFVERMNPQRFPWAVLGLNSERLGEQVIASILLAAATIILSGRKGGFIAPPFVPAEVAMRVYLWGYAFMAVEEAFFTQIILGTAIERMGIVPGSFAAAVVFTVFHWNVYGWSFQILTALFIYRVVAGVLSGIYRSVIPCAFPHLIINMLAATGG